MADMRHRRNSDAEMRRLERLALQDGDPSSIERLSVARVRTGLPAIPEGISARCLRVLLGVGPSALVRVGWDELVPHLGLQGHLIWFDGSEVHVPEWIDDQSYEDGERWLEEEWKGPRLTENQQIAVRAQFLYALEPEWMPSRRIKKSLIERWIVDPINADSGGFWRTDTDRKEELCTGTAISVESIDESYSEGDGVTFRVFEPFFTALFAHSGDDGRDLLVEKITSDDVLEAASLSRRSGEVRVVLPEHPSWDYTAPSRATLEKAIRDAAPKPKTRRKGEAVKKRRNSTQEERSIRALKDELDDAIFFKYPESRIAALRERIASLEGAPSAPPPEGAVARRERLEQEAFRLQSVIERLLAQASQLARQIESLERDLQDSIRMRDPASEIKALRDGIAVRRAEHAAISLEIDAQTRVLSGMATTAHAELAATTPAPVEPEKREQRRTYDGRPLGDEDAREIDRLTDMANRGALTKREVLELLSNARRRYQQVQRSESLRSSPLVFGGKRLEPDAGGQDPEETLRELGFKIMILDHVLNTAFKVERVSPPPPKPAPRQRSFFMEDRP